MELRKLLFFFLNVSFHSISKQIIKNINCEKIWKHYDFLKYFKNYTDFSRWQNIITYVKNEIKWTIISDTAIKDATSSVTTRKYFWIRCDF